MWKWCGKPYICSAINQHHITMASINFRTRGKDKPNASIYITFRNGRNCTLEINSGVTVPNSDWIAKGKTRNIAAFTNKLEVQKKLDALHTAVSSELNNTADYSKNWLQGIVNKFHGIADEVTQTEPTLAAMVAQYVDYITHKAGETRAQGTTKTYKLTQMRIEKFDAHKGHTTKVSEAGVLFKGEFIQWARDIEKYNPATYLKTAKQIKTVIRYAQRIGLTIDETLLKDTESTEPTRSRTERRRPLYLNAAEIDRLMTFTGPDYLENARDWLVVSCWTGCRVSDLMHLTADNIHITIRGDRAIRYTQQKTGDRINAPFHPHVEQITARHGGGFPRPISHQRYNDYIKELCKMVGMTAIIEGAKRDPKTNRKKVGKYPKHELVTSHIGRRSFATNHYGQLPTEIIMLVTGHDTVKQFLDYVGADPEEHVTLINAFYRQETGKKAANV